MFRFRSDLPLRKTSAGHFVQWLVMVLVFMAAIATTVSSYTGAMLDHWNRSVSGTLTVQIPAPDAGVASDQTSRDVDTALAALRREPAVALVAPVPRAKVLELLAPWLGTGGSVNDLPLPALIDVQLEPGHGDAVNAIAAALQKAVPAAVIDDHRVWLSRLTNLAQGIGAVALALTALVGAALTLTVVFATRASLAEFAQVIEILHLVGARDDYIAAQFSRRALNQAVIGGVCGLLIYAPALGAIAWLASRVQQGILPDVNLPALHWLIVALLPLIAGIIAMITAHLTVRRRLQAML